MQYMIINLYLQRMSQKLSVDWQKMIVDLISDLDIKLNIFRPFSILDTFSYRLSPFSGVNLLQISPDEHVNFSQLVALINKRLQHFQELFRRRQSGFTLLPFRCQVDLLEKEVKIGQAKTREIFERQGCYLTHFLADLA